MFKNSYLCGNYHLGHVFMDRMARRPANGICTIDAATGKKETNSSVLLRSIALAQCLRRAGLKPGDVLLLGGTLHLDIHIPYYSALLNGMPIVGIDPFSKYDEIKAVFDQTKPKIAFCQLQASDIYGRVADDLGIDVKIVTFDEGECTLSKFLEIYGDNNGTIDKFQPADFDTDKIYAWLVSTSGTTGQSKIAAFKHKDVIEKFFKLPDMLSPSGDSSKLACDFSTVQWISSYLNTIYFPLVKQCTMLISMSNDTEVLIDVINKYRPAVWGTNNAIVSRILKNGKHCDLTCFDSLTVYGSRISKQLIEDLKSRMRSSGAAMESYGMTETMGPVFLLDPMGPIRSCGVATPDLPVKLVDPETGVDITQPNITGELLVNGPCFTEYYNCPEETAEAFTEDGWFKSGDLFYRDENHNYYFVDRLRLLIKCNGKIMPPEVEDLILTLEGVQEVCVIGIPDPDDGQHPVACVVRRPGCEVTAQEIKDLVADKLSTHKQLRGGVVFLEKLPMTCTGKVARCELQKIVLQAHRE